MIPTGAYPINMQPIHDGNETGLHTIAKMMLSSQVVDPAINCFVTYEVLEAVSVLREGRACFDYLFTKQREDQREVAEEVV